MTTTTWTWYDTPTPGRRARVVMPLEVWEEFSTRYSEELKSCGHDAMWQLFSPDGQKAFGVLRVQERHLERVLSLCDEIEQRLGIKHTPPDNEPPAF